MMGGDDKKEKASAGIKRLSQTLQRRQLMLNVKKLQLQRRTCLLYTSDAADD